jgi:hypothetical protein
MFECMAFDKEHIYFTFGGHSASNASTTSPEIWQCGVRYCPNNAGLGVEDTFHTWSLDDAATAVATWFQQVTMYFASDTRLDWVKAARIGVAGHYMEEPRIKVFTPYIQGGGGSAQLLPLQVSVAVTLDTGKTIGRAKRGRIYLPPMSLVARTLTSAALGQTNQQNMCDGTKNMLAAVQGEISQFEQEYKLAVMSNIGTGSHNFVTKVEVGSIVDTQRRRRNQIKETYYGAPATVGF